eukprot:COSAG05_NODE_1265_length_5336_cov_4.379607_3_plen_164_part_00
MRTPSRCRRLTCSSATVPNRGSHTCCARTVICDVTYNSAGIIFAAGELKAHSCASFIAVWPFMRSQFGTPSKVNGKWENRANYSKRTPATRQGTSYIGTSRSTAVHEKSCSSESRSRHARAVTRCPPPLCSMLPCGRGHGSSPSSRLRPGLGRRRGKGRGWPR